MSEKEEDGFTLIEVLIALAILSVSLAVLLNVFSASLNRLRASEDAQETSLLAQSLLDSIGTTIPLRTGTQSGEFQDGYRWRLEVKQLGTDEDRDAWPAQALSLSVSVGRSEGGTTATINSIRVKPKEKP